MVGQTMVGAVPSLDLSHVPDSSMISTLYHADQVPTSFWLAPDAHAAPLYCIPLYTHTRIGRNYRNSGSEPCRIRAQRDPPVPALLTSGPKDRSDSHCADGLFHAAS